MTPLNKRITLNLIGNQRKNETIDYVIDEKSSENFELENAEQLKIKMVRQYSRLARSA